MSGTTRIKDYDEAHLARWKDYFANTYWVNFSGETIRDVRNYILMNRAGFDQNAEQIYPFLAVRRIGIPEPKEGQNLSASNRGYRNGKDESRLTLTEYTLTYNVDIYATDRATFDELCVEICDTFHRNPVVTVKTEDEDYGRIATNIYFQSIEDNSDLQGEENSIRIFRATVSYTADCQILRRFRHLSIREPSVDFVEKT